jgi:hypothetical protein
MMKSPAAIVVASFLLLVWLSALISAGSAAGDGQLSAADCQACKHTHTHPDFNAGPPTNPCAAAKCRQCGL